MKKNVNRILSFEPIRAIAIIGVFLYHLNPSAVPYGYLGVVTLFVLAGFLSFHHLKRKTAQPYFEQIARKWFKLFPPLITLVFIISILMILLFPNFLGSFSESVRSSLLGYNNYQQIYSGDSYFQGQLYLKPFTHLWAIALEIQFYLLFILGVSHTYQKKQDKQWTISLIIISLISIIIFSYNVLTHNDPTPAYYGFLSRLFSFTLGMLARQLLPLIRVFKLKRLLTLILFIISNLLFIIELPMITQMILYSLILSLLLMVSAWETTFLRTLGQTKPIKWLSSRSYFIYLWHYPIIEIGSRLTSNIKLPTILFMVLMIVISGIVSELFYWLHKKFHNQFMYHLITLIISIALLLVPFNSLYELRADDDFKSLETALTQEPELEVVKPVEPIEPPKDVLTLSPKESQADFQESFVSYFDQLNQIQPEINYTFDDFLRYREIPVTLIGDSIAYIAQPHFSTYLPNIITSAQKSRLLEEADQYYFELKENNQIQDILVLSFGTNSLEETDEGLIKIVEDYKDKPIIILDLVMPYPINEQTRNDLIHQFVERYDNVYLASWYDYSKTHPEFFAPDFMHPNDLGSRAFIHLITNKVIEIAKELENQGKLIIE